ncbi:SDR family NAD(P)-dependent oxidoreductase [Streptomyces sp. NPDC058221]|uniref:SDR family NAD(P)-dependent oxidoreductase n=1 Tax=Streptomyces sp. NPDC058221 TaxID=3346388 RepID=UPI0036E7AB9B
MEDVLWGREGAASLDRVDVVQPVLFSVMVSLAALWKSYGVRPAAVVGHSQGEIAAAYVAGALGLDDAARIVALRSKVLRSLAGSGGMVSVTLPVTDVETRYTATDRDLGVAAVNGPSSTVVSGAPEALDRLMAACEKDAVQARRIPVDYASHSPQVEVIHEELLDLLAGITPSAPDVPFYSTLTGGLLPADRALDADYWYDNLRHTVRFEEATRSLIGTGHHLFIEASAHPVLTFGVDETLESAGVSGAAVGSLRRDEGGRERFFASVAEAWVNGAEVKWPVLFEGCRAKKVTLPTYAFQRDRYWLDVPAETGDVGSVGLTTSQHGLVGAAVELAGGQGTVFTGLLSCATHPWLADHEVGGAVLLPGAGFVELALHAAEQVGCGTVEELTIEAPLVLGPGREAVRIQVMTGDDDGKGRRSVTVHSRSADDGQAADAPWTRHATGILATADTENDSAQPSAEPTAWPPAGARLLPVDDAYDLLADIGFTYGPAFQGLRAAWRLDGNTYAEISLPDDVPATGFGIHPGLLDSALHPLALATGDDDASDQVMLPFSWSGIRLHADEARDLRVSVTSAGTDTVSLRLDDIEGAPVLTVESLTARPIPLDELRRAAASPSSAKGTDQLFQVDWTGISDLPEADGHVVPDATVPDATGPDREGFDAALLGDDPFGLTEALSAALGGASPAAFPDLAALGEAVASGLPLPVDVLFTVPPRPADTDPATGAHDTAARVLALAQEWLADERFAGARLVVVTRDAVAVHGGEHTAAPDASAVWGLLRSAQSEEPGRFGLLDLDSQTESAAALPAALRSGEPQLAVRHGVVQAARLARADTSTVLAPPEGEPTWRLNLTGKGGLEGLAFDACPEVREPLRSGYVRIAVRAAGLNFRDILLALGMVPDDERPAAGEGSGVVLEVGPGVSAFAPGDRVMGLMSGGMGPITVADARLLAPMPKGFSFAEAAGLPVVFLTAYYGLADLAGIRAGESLLLHAATGGVGMAALQLAQHWGVEVYGTASPGKWATLRALGLDDAHIASSRELDFEQQFLHATDGQGVNVVLNSLAREYIDASLRLLPRGGRFLEMGKTDIRDAQEIAAEYSDVHYQVYDVLDAGPDRIQEMLTELVWLFDSGALRPLPVTAWDIHRAPEAFRHFSQAKHTGKIVLTLPAPSNPEGTTIITGGTGTLGSLLARHLVSEHGVKHLLLSSRRGRDADGADDLVDELITLGAETVTIAACDVADRDQLADMLDSVPEEHPLTAVIHAAGVIDDAVIPGLNPTRLDTVFRPKLDAAWHLHELTRDLDLSAFVLFSSLAGTLGTAGQANYAAANAFLDSLAQDRHSNGLAATSLAWGLWEEASTMTGHLDEAARTRLERAGARKLTNEQGLALFDAAYASHQAVLVTAPLDTAALRTTDPSALPHMVRSLVRTPARRVAAGRRTAPVAGGEQTWSARLAGLKQAQQRALLLELVRTHVAAVLGHSSPGSVVADRAFKEIGFDSLTAVELRNRLKGATGLPLAATLVFDHPTPAALAEQLREQLAPPAIGGTGTVAAVLAELSRLENSLDRAAPGAPALEDPAVDGVLTDEETYTELTTRLQDVLVKLGNVRDALGDDAGNDADSDVVNEKITSASDDEIFDFIDNELGIS